VHNSLLQIRPLKKEGREIEKILMYRGRKDTRADLFLLSGLGFQSHVGKHILFVREDDFALFKTCPRLVSASFSTIQSESTFMREISGGGELPLDCRESKESPEQFFCSREEFRVRFSWTSRIKARTFSIQTILFPMIDRI
ncbi:MAG: hypothetical protein AAGM67_09390, partial [Bacteroidota bacterium]